MKIHDYGLIGDGRSAALVSRAGSIDWLCWPRFDSPPIFGGLLDEHRGGGWQIAAASPARATQRYVEHTNVLETTFDDGAARVVLTDAMTIGSEDDRRLTLVPDHELVRRLECVRGEIEIEVRVEPRPDFGCARARIADRGSLGLRWEIDHALLTLRADVPIAIDQRGGAAARLHMRAGDVATFSLTFDDEAPAVLPPLGRCASERVERTIRWWRTWISRARYEGPDRERVLRSALALKLMSFAPSGAIIAAPTTSLPEREGGELNWDYRLCWLRDASFTARVLLDLGYTEDAEAFCSWLLHATRLTRPELRVMYDVYGNRPVKEYERPELAGYRGSRPVRIGNAAYAQLQLDMYGEVIDATAQLVRVTGEIDRDTRGLLREFGDYVARHWSLPDAGIWEPRGNPRHRTHSRLMCWVALDRLLDLHQEGTLDRIDRTALLAQRSAIRADIEHHAFDRALGCYTSALGPSELDASVLLMSWYGFHAANDPRMVSTFARIRDRLGAGPGLLYRYEDSLRRCEGAFWICSFWAIEHLVRGGGSLAQARQMFDAACGYASDLGLMAEEIDPRTGDALGNFPQAYTHVGVVSAALSLAQHERATIAAPSSHRSEPARGIRP
ncbi:MAG TPA: glycoside hydrolase family 15 protein [Kofleriaceae bacterium]|nr:glycoside hydrolase family 15 protein [Kofleriaceae bacterium]